MSILPDRRLHFGFVHRWCADWLAFFYEPDFAMRRESRARRNQVTHDDVLLESAEAIHFSERSRFGEHARCVLERRRRNKAVGFERCLGDAEQHRNGFRRFAAFIDDLFVLFLEENKQVVDKGGKPAEAVPVLLGITGTASAGLPPLSTTCLFSSSKSSLST